MVKQPQSIAEVCDQARRTSVLSYENILSYVLGALRDSSYGAYLSDARDLSLASKNVVVNPTGSQAAHVAHYSVLQFEQLMKAKFIGKECERFKVADVHEIFSNLSYQVATSCERSSENGVSPTQRFWTYSGIHFGGKMRKRKNMASKGTGGLDPAMSPFFNGALAVEAFGRLAPRTLIGDALTAFKDDAAELVKKLETVESRKSLASTRPSLIDGSKDQYAGNNQTLAQSASGCTESLSDGMPSTALGITEFPVRQIKGHVQTYFMRTKPTSAIAIHEMFGTVCSENANSFPCNTCARNQKVMNGLSLGFFGNVESTKKKQVEEAGWGFED